MMTYDISLLTVSQNPKNLKILLDSIENSNMMNTWVELICSWNGDDECPLDTNDYSFDVRIINEKPYHFSKNNNMLAEQARGKYVLFINDDVQLDKNCLKNSYKAIQKRNIGMVGANLRFANQNVQHAGVFFDDDNMPYHRYKNQIHYTDPRVGNNLVVPAITGAYIMMDRKEFLEVRFEEKLFS